MIAFSRGSAAETPVTRFHCYGKLNFGAVLALLLILVFVPNGVREPLMLVVAAASYFFTPQRVFEANEFSWRPFIEVAWIFLGIFGTMIPVLDYVEFHASDFHLASDARFYWSTGLLSGVLDNAPTYLAFLTASLSLDHLDINRLPDVVEFASGHGSRLAPFRWRRPFSAASPTSGTVESADPRDRGIAPRADSGISRLYY